MGDLMGDLRNNPRPPFPPGRNGGPLPPQGQADSGMAAPQNPIRQPLPPVGDTTGQGMDPIRQPMPPVGETPNSNGFPGSMPPEMAPPTTWTMPPNDSNGQSMNSLPPRPPIRQPLPPQSGGPGREFSGGPTFSPGAPKMTDQTNNARKISAPRIPPMSGGAPAWYGKNAPQGGSFTPPPSAGLMAGQDSMNRKRKSLLPPG